MFRVNGLSAGFTYSAEYLVHTGAGFSVAPGASEVKVQLLPNIIYIAPFGCKICDYCGKYKCKYSIFIA